MWSCDNNCQLRAELESVSSQPPANKQASLLAHTEQKVPSGTDTKPQGVAGGIESDKMKSQKPRVKSIYTAGRCNSEVVICRRHYPRYVPISKIPVGVKNAR